MPPRADVTGLRWRERLLPVAALLLVSVWRTFPLSDGTIADPYHVGEYFAALASLEGRESGAFPLTIHGALDYLPGLAAAMVLGECRHFLPTIVLYPVLSLAAAMVFLWLAEAATLSMADRPWVLLAVGFVAPILVSYRDLVLLSCIALLMMRDDVQSRRLAILVESATGVALAFGLLWSFDRGIAGAVAIGAACALRLRAGKGGQWTLATFVVSVPLFAMFPAGNSITSYVENVMFLAATSFQWSYGWTPEATAVTLLLGVATLWALGLLVVNLRVSSQRASKLGTSVMLALLCVFFFRIGTNRADSTHLLMGLWAPLLAALYVYGAQPDARLSVGPRLGAGMLACGLLVAGYYYDFIEFVPVAAVLIVGAVAGRGAGRAAVSGAVLALAAAATAAVAVVAVAHGISAGKYGWVRSIGSLPDNGSRVSEGVRWVVGELEKERVNCVFDLSNNGVINGLAGLPGCTRFSYLVYATRPFEEEMIASLARNRPGLIVYSSQSWTYAIDGKPMPERFPELHHFIERNYVTEKCAFDYCLRYLGPRDGSALQ